MNGGDLEATGAGGEDRSLPLSAVASPKVSATAVTRKNFAVPHLLGAAAFAREFSSLSAANPATPYGPLSSDYTRLGTAVVLMSVSAGECYLNERFADAQDVIDNSPGANPAKAFASSKLALWTPKKRKSTAFEGVMTKADTFLELRGKSPMDRGDAIWLNFDALRELRNALHHFSPEWTNLEVEHQALSTRLNSRFSPWQWWNGSELLFPNAWASSSCAEWAVQSARDFIDLHSKLSALQSPLLVDYKDLLKTS